MNVRGGYDGRRADLLFFACHLFASKIRLNGNQSNSAGKTMEQQQREATTTTTTEREDEIPVLEIELQ